MDIRQLRFVLTLSSTLNFRRAAEIEHITQSAFSDQVRRLENELGVRLFDRNSRGVHLTEAGASFVERAERIVDDVRRASEDVRQIHNGSRGELVVGLFAEGLGELTPALVSSFRLASPDVELHFVELTIGTQATAVTEGLVDVAIVRPPFTASGVDVRELFFEPRMAAIAVDHRLASRETVALAEIVDDPVVSTDPRGWGEFWSFDDIRGGSGRSVATVSSVSESLATVAYLGATDTVPAAAARYYRHPGVRYLPIADAPLVSVAIASRAKDRRLLVTAFRHNAQLMCERNLALVPGASLTDRTAG